MAGAAAQKGKRRIHKVKKAKLEEVRSEINVTPLVDVCLVLLIIFMVVTPMLARGKEVPLPRTSNHSSETDKNQPIVAVDKDGRFYFDKHAAANIEDLKKQVEEAWRAAENTDSANRVYIKADKDLEYGKVYPVISAMHELGALGIDLGTNEKKDSDQ